MWGDAPGGKQDSRFALEKAKSNSERASGRHPYGCSVDPIQRGIRITGSFNWSSAAAHTNDETLLVIHSTQTRRSFHQ